MSRKDSKETFRLIYKALDGKMYKLFKIYFGKSEQDLYVNFFNTGSEFKTGIAKVPIGEFVSVEIYNQNIIQLSKLPKFSYHFSGQVHFKSEELGRNYPMLNTNPLNNLNGEHILTFVVTDFVKFEEIKNHELTKKNFILISQNSQNNCQKFRILLHVFKNEIQELKYHDELLAKIKRNDKTIYFKFTLISENSNNNNFDNGFMAISGWDESMSNPNLESKFLYLI